MPSPQNLIVRALGLREYEPVWEDMKRFTAERGESAADELWLLEHPPVYTQGLNGKAEHLLAPGAIPIVQVDRGGQVTYHGPGQLVAYVMMDLTRRGWGVRKLVSALEQAVVDLLADLDIRAAARPDAPGVYVDGAKVASLGLRVRRGKSYHGLSLNVHMDLEPFSRINPCGHQGLAVTQLRDLGCSLTLEALADRLTPQLTRHLGYNSVTNL